jgi:hypothetical protein
MIENDMRQMQMRLIAFALPVIPFARPVELIQVWSCAEVTNRLNELQGQGSHPRGEHGIRLMQKHPAENPFEGLDRVDTAVPELDCFFEQRWQAQVQLKVCQHRPDIELDRE